MVCGHRAFGKQVSVFDVSERFRGGKLTKSRYAFLCSVSVLVRVSVLEVGKRYRGGKRTKSR